MDFGELAFVTVINTMLNMLWGGTLQGEEGAKFKKLIAEQMVLFGKPDVSDLFPVLARFDLQGIERQSKKIFQWSENILDTAIEKQMNSKGGKVLRTSLLKWIWTTNQIGLCSTVVTISWLLWMSVICCTRLVLAC